MHIHASQEKGGLDREISEKIPGFFDLRRRNGPENAEKGGSRACFLGWLGIEILVVASLFSLYAGTTAPEVNESHYLTKAKHFWEPEFAARDLFLASADAHWFFFAAVGWITALADLPIAAWWGRMAGWLGVACGWTLLARRATSLRWSGAMTAPLWMAAIHWGSLSGEWVIGGCEAKVFAYAFAFVGLSEILIHRWSRAWYWLGVSSGFHVLTGGWITLAALLSYAIQREREPLRKQCLGLLVGGSFGLVGLVPGWLLNQGVDAATSEQAAVIYVFQRLPHHLSPLRFASTRWLSFAALVALTMIVVSIYLRVRRVERSGPAKIMGMPALLSLTAAVSTFALCGVLIDAGLSSWASNWAARWLRFYWFRWNDVIWPTLFTLVVWAMAKARWGKNTPIRWGAILILAIPGPMLIAIRYLENQRAIMPPADRASLVFRTESPSAQRQVYRDWLDTCAWIKTNTSANALFLTPRFQQTFKWYAYRAEIACWKDSPQDAKGLIEWEKRMLEIFPRSPEGYGISMSDQHLGAMRLRYGIDYVVLDRRIQTRPPLLPLVHSNQTYAVFEFP